ncbi:winged helix-turn-helix transcriptional regulator [Streptomyces yatensis]|uniref:HTH hxlR-type domain-containing protein n=1 Tax=Streptomyces yatensis TaxID=155177 RepID=A0ABP4UMK3_9ACTN|nr:winged helix-turn-helix transcriptional regulator [Streptomyces yatensis]
MLHPTIPTSDTDRICHAVGVLAPRWTSWTLETLHEHGPMRAHQLTATMPWLNATTTRQVLMRMQSSGLLTKPDRGCYTASPLGQDARPAHRALASWHARHFEVGATSRKRADRVEDALARLRGKGTIEVLTALEQNGPLRPTDLRQTTHLATGSFHYRMRQVLEDGLVTRLGPGQHFAYTLTQTGRSLAPVYVELHDFGRRIRSADVAATANQWSAETSRARAARQRTASAPAVTGLFSHPPEPQPRVPAHIVALSHPSRTR